MEIGSPVLEKKIFEGVLPYIYGQAVSEKKIFEIVDDDGRRRTTDDGRTDAGSWVYYKLTCEPSAQVS